MDPLVSVKSALKYFTPPAFDDAGKFLSRPIRPSGITWTGTPELECVPECCAAEGADGSRNTQTWVDIGPNDL